MKVDTGVWKRRRASVYITAALGLLTCAASALAGGPVGPSDRPEAYFNGSSYIRLSRPISLKQIVGLSFRTCVGGELFSQRFEGYTLHVTALLKQVVVSWARPGQPQREVSLEKSTLDNRWHWVALNYQHSPPTLALEVDKDTQVISNLSLNPELLSPGALEDDGAVVLVGNVFSGCIHEGPQLEFHANAQLRNVEFGNCPLSTTNNCTDRVDVLRRPPKDHCYNEPCMRHGTCISRHDKYECHCSARYTGNNCEVDAGDPCASAPCQHGGRCVEDARGDYSCACAPRYHGMHCELEVSEDPLCVAGPCRNNGSCSVVPGADTYVCSCPPGYTGRNCETDVDECAAAGAVVACLNGGRCVDAVNNFTCDCTNTGYTGARCESNVNECEEERGICGHGVCYDTYGSFVCLCQPGYTGERCHRMSPCATNPCGVGGVCVEEGENLYCVCQRGWAPPLCDTPAAPPCEAACPPRSHCKEATGLPTMVTGVMISKQVTCVCDIGYYGAPGLSPNCTTLELACESGVCQNGATCSLGTDHFNCTCAPGYKGAYCELAAGKALSDLKAPPERCAAQPCVHADACVDLPSGFRCDCSPGWSGARCDAPEACAAPCLNGGACEEGACECRAGYAGAACELAADCRAAGCAHLQVSSDSPTGRPSCLNGGACEEGACECRAGYAGAACELAADCRAAGCAHLQVSSDSPTGRPPCLNGGACEEGACECRAGYAGAACELAADCRAAGCAHLQVSSDSPTGRPPCLNGGACEEGACECRAGYAGAACELAADCRAAGCAHLQVSSDSPTGRPPCLNGGACEEGACECRAGYAGAACELAADCRAAGCAHLQVSSDSPTGRPPCLNGGACEEGACECRAGYAGAACELAADCRAAGCAHLQVSSDSLTGRPPCLNGGACEEGACECRAGYAGAACELAADCRAAGCAHLQECVEQGGAWRCSAPAADSACASSPCNNGSCLVTDAGLARCQCPPGVNGRYCDLDVDECALMPKICNHGVCVNVPGSYQCYCRPGYTGDSCEQDIDECLSSPCKNSGTCQNLENNYECTCKEGFEGKDCSVNINECESMPCAAGSTCIDGVASYSCVCQDGLTGATCEVNIDDCESQPCQHGGRCIDGLNSFTCDCANTGYTGPHCAVNIDECAPAPCRNGGTCRDHVNDYRCDCHPGYSGKNCEIDINECESSPCKFDGICVQRSNISLYRAADAPPLQLGSQPQMLLPAVFYQPFSLEHAAGYECICVAGTTGPRCEVNVDECASGPCRHGKCVDGVGEYSCECAPGYEGQHCEIEIDECLRYQPCANGRCFDGRATYYCECEPGWGGRNCSVVLEGCLAQPCRNNGTCLPWLWRETEHRFNCTCAPGHHGTTCEKVTTMSLEKRSYAEVNTPREEGYDISFRFKTTLGNGLLAMGRGLTYFFLELSNGRLNLHSSLLNKWEGVFIGSSLNDSKWQKVFVTINSTHLVLAANEEQTIYPISQNEVSQGANTSVTSFPSTRLGTAGSSYETLTHGPNFFVGCFQDVVVNNQWVLPEDSNAVTPDDPPGDPEPDTARALLHGVLSSCPRTPQCAPNPCRSGGACEDAWTTFVCTCPRPHLGATCQYNYTAATFGQESATPRSIVTVAVREGARRAVHAALDISMFVRTRKPTGQIFHLGSVPRYGQTDETLVGASLKGGELLVHLRFNQTPEDYTVGGTRLDNGHLHLIQVVRNSTLVQVKLNGTEYFRKSISAAKQLDAQMLYLGGPPPAPPAPADATSPAPAPASATAAAPATTPATTPAPAPREPTDADYFKGVIQDVQVSNGVNVTIVEFFPLRVEGLTLPASFGDVTLDPAGVLPGEVSDDACASQPCLHNATCVVTWNDYTCTCPRGYKGKQCAEVEFCQLQACPLNSHCRNLDGGYECISNATFDGVNTTLSYHLRVPRIGGVASHVDMPDSVTITYRTKVGGTLFRVESHTGEDWFSVGVYKQQATLEWRLRGALPAKRSLRSAAHAHAHWTTLRVAAHRGQLTGSFINASAHEEAAVTATVDQAAWQQLLLQGNIYLGGPAQGATIVPPMESSTDTSVWEYTEGDDFSTDNLAGKYFKGCMGAVYVGSLLLPFFTDEDLYLGTVATKIDAQPHYALIAGKPWGASAGVGCVLCLEQDCARGGRCADVRSSYSCSCPPGYTGDYCEVDVNECESHECQNGATCRDDVAKYACECPEGFSGEFCELDIDECLSAPCLHNGTCSDEPGGYRCACAAEWRGARCQLPRVRSCAHQPCQHRAACSDTPPDPPTGNNYTCTCTEGYVGVHCERAFCELVPCQHGACVTDTKVPVCECEPGFAGAHCETERDECAESAEPACRHGGRCVPRRGGVLCDCAGTGWTGARCEVDLDECAAGLVSCGPGECRNQEGSYTCICAEGYCGVGCALRDPCLANNGTGPCEHGAACAQRCGAAVDYACLCVDGWAGKNCSQQSVSASSDGDDSTSSTVLIAVGCALLVAALAALALGALCAQARRKRATRGTYSPSGQEYCNPRAEMMHQALKPPPEERLI